MIFSPFVFLIFYYIILYYTILLLFKMTSYYNIFEDTEFTIQNTNSEQTYKLFKPFYQKGGNSLDLIYEDNNQDNNQNNNQGKLSNKQNEKFLKSCKQLQKQRFRQSTMQIGGFYIQL